MQFLKDFFGLGKPHEYADSTLGTFRWQTHRGLRGWVQSGIPTLGSPGPTTLVLHGDKNGPAAAAVAAYHQLREKYSDLREGIGAVLFELNGNYFSDEPDKAARSADALWGTETLEAVKISGPDRIELAYHCSWQAPEDRHDITIHVEEWVVRGASIDGG